MVQIMNISALLKRNYTATLSTYSHPSNLFRNTDFSSRISASFFCFRILLLLSIIFCKILLHQVNIMTCQSFCKVIFLRAGVQTLRVQKIMISSFFQCHGMEGYFFQCSRNYFTSWRFCCLSSSIFSATISKYHFPPLILWKLISNIKSRV